MLLNVLRRRSWLRSIMVNDHLSGKSCSFGLPRLPFVNCCQFMYLVISLLVLRAGCGIWFTISSWSLLSFLLYYGAFHVESCLDLCFRVFQSFYHCDHLASERESWSLCFSCNCLFILHTLIVILLLFLLVSGVGCGLWLRHILENSINVCFDPDATERGLRLMRTSLFEDVI